MMENLIEVVVDDTDLFKDIDAEIKHLEQG
jgi:hypothetical protein